MRLIILILSLSFTFADLNHCKRHTNIFKDNWPKEGNSQYAFFDETTFGIDLHTDPCKPITRTTEFRNYVNQHIHCTGKHCVNGLFKCRHAGDKNCYHVEHIIDLNGPELCHNGCKNIMANLVMTWGRWNSALGGLARYYYNESMCEKEFVYGKEIVARVREMIGKCMKNEIVDYDKECDRDGDCDCTADNDCGCDCDLEGGEGERENLDEIKLLYLIVIVLSCALMFGLCCCVVRECKKKKQEWAPLDERLKELNA